MGSLGRGPLSEGFLQRQRTLMPEIFNRTCKDSAIEIANSQVCESHVIEGEASTEQKGHVAVCSGPEASRQP